MTRTEYQATGAYLTCPRGEAQGHAKLTDVDVAMMRRQHARKQTLVKKLNARYSAAAFAEQFGVTVRAIEKALTYDTWRHVAEIKGGSGK